MKRVGGLATVVRPALAAADRAEKGRKKAEIMKKRKEIEEDDDEDRRRQKRGSIYLYIYIF